MPPILMQPDATRIPRHLVAAILRRAVPIRPLPRFRVRCHDQFSNDIAEARLDDGRILMVKRGRYEWAHHRFDASRVAGQLLRRHTELLAPYSLDLPGLPEQLPLDVYWRLSLPTLEELWPGLEAEARRAALHSLGESIRRVHEIRLAGHGPLRRAKTMRSGIGDALLEDLEGRLLPEAWACWPEGIPILEDLVRSVPAVERRVSSSGVLLHGDLHLGNLLCRQEGEGPRCVGMIDLESAHAGPPESDLARLAVIQTDLFEMPLGHGWMEPVLEGYGGRLDPELMGFFRRFHLVHLGCHSARVGHRPHALEVACAAAETLFGS